MVRSNISVSTDDDDFDELSTQSVTRFDPTPEPSVSFVLRDAADATRAFVIDGSQPSRLLIGQSAVCPIRIQDPLVSRRHAAIDLVGDRLRITDLGSTNGTLINGIAIKDAFVRGGERILIGETSLDVERLSEPKAAPLKSGMQFGRMLGASTEMRRLYDFCERLSQSTIGVIIEGETGTGKEVLAEALHDEGPRAKGPFIVFDCTAVPPSLVESELFGHERGAFTGAVGQRKGVFEQAHEGTLLIDEIGDLELALQSKLLRAIERSEFRRVGGMQTIRVDVRLLAATRRNLDQEVQAGRFRDDLFHRLAVARIELPPLRDRRGDVVLLARHFWKELGGEDHALDPDVLRRWEAYSWPGNVRELRNAVTRQLVLGTVGPPPSSRSPSSIGPPSTSIGPPSTVPSASDVDLDVLRRVLADKLPFTHAKQLVLETFERAYLGQVLAEHGGDTQRAAAALGIGRRYFNMIRARHGR
ncbi:MAG: Response regulator of zinc sigma-54-dependent two-component system [Labilithrix sp.]|nr:Response regulator of zinc sigma-54-dependent two-component system [Labilithrix sp.]